MLIIDGLHKRYGDTIALDDASFAVRRGAMTGFLGRNGSGKTTTMRTIFGLVRPDAGAVSWDGHPVGAADQRRFGYMPEERGLYPKMGVLDQLVYLGRLHGMSASVARQTGREWLERLDLTERADDRVEALSQGNQQRVQLAAALIHDPELLILDEPFNGLDPVAANTMAEVLQARAAAGVAVLFSSHQLEVVEDLCEDVVIIDAGRVRLTGTVDELQQRAPYRIVELDMTDQQAQVVGALDGVLDSRFDGRRHQLRVSRDIDLTPLMATVDATHHFSLTAPSLTEIFTEALR